MAELIIEKKKKLLPIQMPLAPEEIAEFSRLKLEQARIYQNMCYWSFILSQQKNVREYIS